MSNKIIFISYQLTEEGKGMEQLVKNSAEIRDIMKATAAETDKLAKSCADLNSIIDTFDSVNNAIGSLQQTLSDLQGAYAAQVEVETQLAVNMRNTMGAREEDIQSIKDLCAAQQQLGVIGDEVQLAGAQELATYLEKKESLAQLIPVMNDMLAQQYGLNATQENAAQIASMLGKVMEGQTGALSRYGYKFDEVQEQILKYGTESERAAVLTEVVESAVGGMNAELAKTDVGKQKQLENALGDLKETFGKVAQKILPAVTVAAQFGQAIQGAITISKGIKTLGPMFQTVTAAISAMKTGISGATLSTKIFGVTLKTVLITSGIGLAIMAIGYAVGYLTGMLDDATESTNELSEAEQRAQEKADQLKQAKEQEEKAMKDSIAAYNLNISRLKSFNGTKAEEERLCKEMNSAYGETMGYYSSVSDWYSTLTKNSATYCRQLVLEAKARRYANDLAEMEIQQDEIDKMIAELEGKLNISGGNIAGPKPAPETFPESKPLTLPGGMPTTTPPAPRTRFFDPTIKSDEVTGNNFVPVKMQDMRFWSPDKWAKELSPWTLAQRGNRDAMMLFGAYAQREANSVAIREKKDQLDGTQTEMAGLQFEKGPTTPPGGGGGGAGNTEPVYHEDAKTIAELKENIRYLEKKRETQTGSELENTNKLIASTREQLKELESAGVNVDPVLIKDPKTIKDYADNISLLNKQIETAGEDKIPELNKKLKENQEGMARLRAKGFDGLIADPKTIKDYTENISLLNKQIETAGEDTLPQLNKQLKENQDALNRLRGLGVEETDPTKQTKTLKDLNPAAKTLKDIQENITILNAALQEADAREASNLNKQIALWQKKADAIQNAGKSSLSVMESMKTTWSNTKGISSGINNISDALEKNGTIWEKLQGIVDGFFQIFDGVSAIVTLINTLTEASRQHAAAKATEGATAAVAASAESADAAATSADTAMTEANTEATQENTIAKGGEAVANATASGAKLPFPANVAAIAAGVAAVVSVLAATGCFASGGIVGGSSPSGDRLVARVNSGEMILNRTQQGNLFKMLNMPALAVRTVEIARPQPAVNIIPSEMAYAAMTDPQKQTVRFRIDGRTLVGVLEKEMNLNLRR